MFPSKKDPLDYFTHCPCPVELPSDVCLSFAKGLHNQADPVLKGRNLPKNDKINFKVKLAAEFVLVCLDATGCLWRSPKIDQINGQQFSNTHAKSSKRSLFQRCTCWDQSYSTWKKLCSVCCVTYVLDHQERPYSRPWKIKIMGIFVDVCSWTECLPSLPNCRATHKK